MYRRDIHPPRPSPLDKGRPVAGTWTKPFDDVNLLDLHRPFAIPLPKWIRNYRIKEWQSFQVQDDRYYLTAAFTNAKFYRIAQVFLYDKDSKEKLLFRKSLPFGSWHLPRCLSNASVSSSSYGFYFRIHDWLDADLVELDLDIKPNRRRPSLTAHLEFDLTRAKTTPLTVCLPFSERRCMVSYKAMSSVRGDLVFGGSHINFETASTSGMVFDYKGYYPYRMRNTWCTGFGADASGRRFGFSVGENQARDSFRNNENSLWLEGAPTPLPPVRVTMPDGPEGDWIIQDVEGMVDLTFTPLGPAKFSFNLLLTRSEYHAPFGVFNGMVATTGGEKIMVRNLWGLGEILYLRV